MSAIDMWNFDNGIADEFEKHVRQSVPGYELFTDYIVKLSRFYVGVGTGNVLDLGAGTGELAESLLHYNRDNLWWLTVVENSTDMLRKILTRFQGNDDTVVIVKQDLANDCDYLAKLKKSLAGELQDFIVMSLVLQFLPITARVNLLKYCNSCLSDGGAVVVVEKIIQEEGIYQSMFDTIHQLTKYNNGLSSQQLYDKTQSLVGVMTPLTCKENEEMFEKCGFKVTPFFQLGGFKGWILRKQI